VVLEVLGLGFDDRPPALAGASVADELLRPTIIYAGAFRALEQAGLRFKAAAHITGGGLIENPPRFLVDDNPSGALAVELDTATWTVPPIFGLIASAGVEQEEMRRTFNLGLGMVVVVSAADAAPAVAALRAAGSDARAVGRLVPRSGGAAVVFR
jgi:phosphoribosylformylglycinamidine cyclo-ligase